MITDGNGVFDEIAAGYHGPLYLEVVPLSFPVMAATGLALNQLAVDEGRPGG